jgi:hypothetical protein
MNQQERRKREQKIHDQQHGKKPGELGLQLGEVKATAAARYSHTGMSITAGVTRTAVRIAGYSSRASVKISVISGMLASALTPFWHLDSVTCTMICKLRKV